MNVYYQSKFSNYPWTYSESFDSNKSHQILDLATFQTAPLTHPTGVRFHTHDTLDELSPELIVQFAIVELDFPAFTDGRNYSKAYRLRHDFSYTGCLVAVGDVLIDQLYLMQQCGIDAFLFQENYDLQRIQKALRCFSVPPQKQLFK